MIPPGFATALANHLWQSTLFAGLAALLALLLRENHARIRYWLWLIASLKFLLPFSILAAAGSRLGWLTAARISRPALPLVVEQIGQPFPPTATTVPLQTSLAHNASLLPAALLAIWGFGFLIAAVQWLRHWRRIHATVCAGAPLDIAAARDAGITALSSSAMLEPGVFGIFRPVLLLPEGIADRMPAAHLDAVIAHELCHVRRRDNLAAAFHMAVEAIFWFHPLVWWLGARLVEERERACDEEVLRLGSLPEIYAESILKTCQFYLESPLISVSGISGSDLKKRIVRIMTHSAARRLTLSRKIMLAAAGLMAIAGPLVFGLMNAPQRAASSPRPAFDAISIKLNRSGAGQFKATMDPRIFRAENATARFLVLTAYGLREAQIFGGPAWIDSEHFDVQAQVNDFVNRPVNMDLDAQSARLNLMLQSLLAKRFKLSLHHETRELAIYALVAAKGGPKLHEPPLTPGDDQRVMRGIGIRPGQIVFHDAPLNRLAETLSHQLGRMVVNETGLNARYDFTLNWTPGGSGASIFAAIQEQLGLKLEAKRGPVDTIVVDHIEKPSEN